MYRLSRVITRVIIERIENNNSLMKMLDRLLFQTQRCAYGICFTWERKETICVLFAGGNRDCGTIQRP